MTVLPNPRCILQEFWKFAESGLSVLENNDYSDAVIGQDK
jgi:hypothetical protein